MERVIVPICPEKDQFLLVSKDLTVSMHARINDLGNGIYSDKALDLDHARNLLSGIIRSEDLRQG